MNVKIKLLSAEAKIPTKAHSTDACFDIYACEPDAVYPDAVYREWNGGLEIKEVNGLKIRPHETVKIHTGFATEIPVGYYAAVYARSGLSTKQGLRPANCVGVIDAAFRGEWIVALHNDSSETRIVKHGDRIAQFAVLPVLDIKLEESNELNSTERGTGGFGSSGV